jgi:hypothetical protein
MRAFLVGSTTTPGDVSPFCVPKSASAREPGTETARRIVGRMRSADRQCFESEQAPLHSGEL